MADEERDDQQQPEATEPEAPAPEPDETPESEAPAPEPAEPEAPAADAVEPAPASEPEEQLSPKERRRRRRSRHGGPALPQRDAAERARERKQRRERNAASRRRWRARRREAQRGRPGTGPARTAPVVGEARAAPRERQGIVVSNKADKTIVVRIDVTRRHRAYKKIVRESSTLHAHDERNDAGEGDTVKVVESRPLSRTKRWRLVEVLERAR